MIVHLVTGDVSGCLGSVWAETGVNISSCLEPVQPKKTDGDVEQTRLRYWEAQICRVTASFQRLSKSLSTCLQGIGIKVSVKRLGMKLSTDRNCYV